MPRPFFHERGIACGTTWDKVPMAKMDTVKDLIIINHLYKFFLMKNRLQAENRACLSINCIPVIIFYILE